jgi:hypothetical protein
MGKIPLGINANDFDRMILYLSNEPKGKISMC